MKDSARQKIETGLPLTILDKLLTNSYRNVFIINSINIKNPGEIMSYEQNSVMMSSLSFNKRGGEHYTLIQNTPLMNNFQIDCLFRRQSVNTLNFGLFLK